MHCRRLHRVLFLAWAVLALVGCGCSTNAPPRELADAGVERQLVGASGSGPGPSDSGIPHVRGGLTQPVASAVDIRSVPDFYPPLVDAGVGVYVAAIDDAGDASWTQLTTDVINALPAAFAPTLSFASGGTSPVEISATDNITPTFTGSPLPNAAGVTVYTIADSQGGGPTSRLGSGSGFQGPSASYHATAPATLTFTANITKNGVNKNATASIAIDERWFRGTDSHSGGNAITASSTNATLSGGSASATLTGALAANFVGVSFSTSPSSEYVYMAFPHTGSAHTFKDQNGFVFAASVVVTSFSYTTVTGVTGVAYDIYRSDNLLNTSYTVTVVSMLEPPWLDTEPANDDGGRGAMPKSEAA